MLTSTNMLSLSFIAPPIIVVSPPPRIEVDPAYTITINCTAMGIPTPEIVWRLNWGCVPQKCTMTSVEQVNTVYISKSLHFILEPF